MIPLKKSTASQEVLLGPFLDDTTGKDAETLLSIANTDIKLWKAGGTSEVSKNSNGATHIASGRYYAVLDATDTDTEGPLLINVHVSGALPVRLECVVLPANVYDSLIGGTDNLEVDAIQWLGTAPLNTTTIDTLSSQTVFRLLAGSTDDKAYKGCLAIITKQGAPTRKCFSSISSYTGSTKEITLAADPQVFTIAAGDTVDIVLAASAEAVRLLLLG